MKFLLDEMLSKRIAEALRDRGVDAIAVTERPDLVSMPDAVLLSVASDEDRVLVTNNIRDFRSLHGRSVRPGGDRHSGIVYVPGSLPRSRGATGSIVSGLLEIIETYDHGEGLQGSEAWVSQGRI